jgi:hypothetical protein
MGEEPNLESALAIVASYDGRDGDPVDYTRRYEWLIRAALDAVNRGIPVGFRIDPAEPEWPVIMFELPTGQVSWHLPQHPMPWDGHTTDEKYARIDAFRAASQGGLG